MKFRRLISVVLGLLLLLGAVPCAAAQSNRDCEQTERWIEEILAYEMNTAGVSEVQSLADGRLALRAGIDAEWYAVALAQYDSTLSLDVYADALERYLADNRIVSASTRQKHALALIAAGRENTAFVRDTLNDSIGQLGIMSLVFGLHLLNNGLPSDDYTPDSLVDALLARQLTDGGYAVSGDVANADVTAMVLQALAPHRERTDVRAATDASLACLSAMQHADGSFESYGVSNAESCAQVLMALCALEIDPYADDRFIQGGNTVVDALVSFATADGGYAHEMGGEVSLSATAQALCAYVSLWRAQNGLSFLYLLEHVNYDPSLIPAPPVSDVEEPSGDAPRADARMWVSLGVGALALIGAVMLLLIKKKKGVRDACLVLLTAAVAVVLIATVRVRTPEDYYGTDGDMGEVIGTVTLEIRCDTVAGLADHIPSDGGILAATEFSLCEGDSAYDVLIRAAREHRILVETNGGTVGESSSLYIQGINNLYEFDYGELSGWVYTVNGIMPSRGCDSYRPVAGDDISFLYTTNLGEDVGGEVAE